MTLQEFLIDLFARHYGKHHTPNTHKYTILYEAAHLWSEERIRHQRNIIAEQSKEIAALKSKLNTGIPTLDRNTTTATLKDGREVFNIPDTDKWVDKAMKYSYPGKWSERLTFTLICKLLEKNGFIEYPSGYLTHPASGHFISFVAISKYNSVEAFQKDWPYK